MKKSTLVGGMLAALCTFGINSYTIEADLDGEINIVEIEEIGSGTVMYSEEDGIDIISEIIVVPEETEAADIEIALEEAPERAASRMLGLICGFAAEKAVGEMTAALKDAETEVETETEMQTEIETHTETETEMQTETETETETEMQTETETETETEMQTEMQTETETEIEIETETEAQTDTEIEIETETKTEVELETEISVDIVEVIETETELPTENNTETETEAVEVAITETEAVTETEPTTQSETAPLTESERIQDVDLTIYEKLEKMVLQDERMQEIVDHYDSYPEDMLALLSRNIDMLDFVLGYPEKKGQVYADTIGEAEEGVFPLLLQWDERWGYGYYGDGENTLAVSGCAPTALAMIVAGLTGDASNTPYEIAQYAQAEGYYVSGIGTSWDLMTWGCQHFGVYGETISLSEESVFSTLESGTPIACSMRPGDFTTGGHFIVLTGIEDGKIRVNDPNSIVRSNQLWDYEVLAGQIKNLWAFWRL